ncbi:MAG: hypothetical protein STHCBS139747_005301 [Sporothrix thermara]
MPAVIISPPPPERSSIWAQDDKADNEESNEEHKAHQQHQHQQTHSDAQPAIHELLRTGGGQDSAASLNPSSTLAPSPLTLAHPQTPQTTAHWLVLAAPVVVLSSLLVAVYKSSRRRTNHIDETTNIDNKNNKRINNINNNNNNKSRVQSELGDSPPPSPSPPSPPASPFTSLFPAAFDPPARSASSACLTRDANSVQENYKSRGLPDTSEVAATLSDAPTTHKLRFLSTAATYNNTTTSTTTINTNTNTNANATVLALRLASAPAPFLQKRLRRVYHLQNNIWPAQQPPMDDKGRAASATATATASLVAADSSSNAASPDAACAFSMSPRPPPLPLSTSSFAFEQPSLLNDDDDDDDDGRLQSDRDRDRDRDLAPHQQRQQSVSSEDASEVSFIHQPNPDYSGEGDISFPPAATTSTPAAPPATGGTAEQHSLPGDLPHSPFLMAMVGETQHTQAFGGGVCLACLAAANSGALSEEDGPMYGASVPLADRRHA